LPYLDVTLLVTLEGSARDTGVALELATADVVIGLEYRTDGWRHLRRLEIVKQRGRAPLPGLHAYAITSAGIALSPRLEALLLNSEPGHGTIREHTTRASFGLPELDSLLDGGLGARTITLLAAAPGVGKTLLALHWALAPVSCDVAQPGKTLYLTFHEHIGELRQKASAFGLPLERALEEDAMQIIRLLPIELNPDYAVTKIIEAATSGSAHRLVIDDLGSLLAELGPRARDFLSALKELLYRSGMTSLLLLEIPPLQGLRLDLESVPLSLMADNVIIVQQYHAAGTLHRILTVLKMRFSSHDRTFRELVVANNRIRVLSPAETAPGVLDQIEASLDAGALSATQKRSG
jgi:circadian clock protein KaiC